MLQRSSWTQGLCSILGECSLCFFSSWLCSLGILVSFQAGLFLMRAQGFYFFQLCNPAGGASAEVPGLSPFRLVWITGLIPKQIAALRKSKHTNWLVRGTYAPSKSQGPGGVCSLKHLMYCLSMVKTRLGAKCQVSTVHFSELPITA